MEKKLKERDYTIVDKKSGEITKVMRNYDLVMFAVKDPIQTKGFNGIITSFKITNESLIIFFNVGGSAWPGGNIQSVLLKNASRELINLIKQV